MIYHVITTPECNLQCSYCCGKAFDEPQSNIEFESVPNKPEYSMEDLNSFLARDKNGEVSLIFYGGEPLMNLEFIRTAMDSQKKFKTVKNFLIQTNGILLHALGAEYTNLFHTILVSVDGGKEITDKNRGGGTWERVTKNLKLVRANGFCGEIIARMAVEEPTDFFSDAMELINPKSPEGFRFTSLHWQLDANMWHDYEKRNFALWSKEYNSGVSKLADYWMKELKKGNVIRIYPFMGIIDSLLNGTNYFMRCGSGIENFSILPNGKIAACPIMSGVKEKYLGSISTAQPQSLPFKITVKEPCTSCPDLALCGGRCLYSNLYPVWPKKGIDEVCGTVRHLIKEMKRIAPKIKKLIDEGKLKQSDLQFLKYNSAEIIP